MWMLLIRKSVAGTLMHDIIFSLSLSLTHSYTHTDPYTHSHITLTHKPWKILDDWERNRILINKFRHRILNENIYPRVHSENRRDVKSLSNEFPFFVRKEFLSFQPVAARRSCERKPLFCRFNFPQFFVGCKNYVNWCDILSSMLAIIIVILASITVGCFQ